MIVAAQRLRMASIRFPSPKVRSLRKPSSTRSTQPFSYNSENGALAPSDLRIAHGRKKQPLIPTIQTNKSVVDETRSALDTEISTLSEEAQTLAAEIELLTGSKALG